MYISAQITIHINNALSIQDNDLMLLMFMLVTNWSNCSKSNGGGVSVISVIRDY